MYSIYISDAAINRIRYEKSCLDNNSAIDLVPCINYYRRSYSTLRDGQIIEHGDGIVLSFIDKDCALDDQYMCITIDGGEIIAVSPSDHFKCGRHSIGWNNGKFKLGSQ